MTKRIVCWLLAAGLWATAARQLPAQPAEPAPLSGHESPVYAAAFTPDGKLVVTGSFDRTLRVWSAADGDPLRTLLGHDNLVLSLDVNHDGRQMVSGAQDNTLRLWDLPSGSPDQVYQGHKGPLTRLLVFPDGKTLATFGADGQVLLWRDDAQDAAKPKQLQPLGTHEAPVTAAVLGGGATQLASGDAAGQLIWWQLPADDRPELAAVKRLAHRGAVSGMAFLPNNEQLVSAGAEGVLKYWQLPMVDSLRLPAPEVPLSAVVVTPGDNPLAVVAGADKALHIFELASGKLLRSIDTGRDGLVVLALSPDGQRLAAVDAAGHIDVFALADGAPLGTLAGHTGAVQGVAFAPNNQQLATAGQDGSLRHWQLPVPRVVAAGHEMDLRAVAFAPNAAALATAADDKTVKIFNTADGALVRTLEGAAAALRRVAWRGEMIAAGDQQGTILLWSAGDGKPLGSLTAHQGSVRGLLLLDGQFFSAGQDGLVKRWQMPLEAPKVLAHAMPPRDAALARDGKLLATAAADGVRLFETAGGQQQRALAVAEATSVALSADSSLVVAADQAGTLHLYHTADGQPRGTLAGHTGAIARVVVHPSGTQLASAGADGTVRLWRLPQPPLVLADHTMPARSVAATPDGARLLTGGADKVLRIFNTADGAAAAALQGHMGAIQRLALAADGQIASGDEAGFVRLWSPAGEPAGLIGGHTAAITGVHFLPGDEAASLPPRLLTGGADGLLKTWRLPPVAPRPLEGSPQPLVSAALSSDASRAATLAADGAVRFYDVQTGQAVALEGPVMQPTALALAGDGTLLAVSSAAGTVKLWNAAENKALGELAGHTGAVRGVAIAPDAAQVATVGEDGTLRAWSLPQPARVLGGHAQPVRAVAADETGTHWATAGEAAVRLWSADQAEPTATLAAPAPISSVGLSPKGDVVLAGDDQGRVLVWQAGAEAPRSIGGHEAAVRGTAWLPAAPAPAGAAAADVPRFASAGADGTVKIWRPADPPLAWPAPPQPITAAQAVRQGDQVVVVTAAADGALRVWDRAGKLLRTLNPPEQPGAVVALSTTATHAAALYPAGTVHLWALADGKLLGTRAAGADARQVAIAPGAAQLATGHADGKLRQWAVDESPEALREIAAHNGAVTALLYAADGQTLYSGGADNQVKAFAAADGKPLRAYAGHAAAVADVTLSGDGALVASVAADKTLRVWKSADAAAVAQFTLPDVPQRIHLAPDNTRAAVAGQAGLLNVYDLAAGCLVERFLPAEAAPPWLGLGWLDERTLAAAAADRVVVYSPSVHRAIVAHRGALTALAAARQTPRLAVLSDDHRVQLLLPDEAKPPVALAGASGALNCVALRGDGAQAAAGGEAKIVYVWSAADGKLLRSITTPAAVTQLAYSADGARLAVAGQDGRLRVFDTADGQLLEEGPLPAPSRCLAFAGNSGVLTNGAAQDAVHAPLALRSRIAAHAGGAQDVVYLAGGKWLATCGADKLIRVWDTATLGEVGRLSGAAAGAVRLAVSGDGARLAAACTDKTLRVWAPPLPKPDAPPPAADTPAWQSEPIAALAYPAPQAVALNADGTRLAAAGEPTFEVALFDVESQQLLERFAGHTAAVRGVQMAANGQLITAADDKLARVWTPAVLSARQVSAMGLHSLAVSPTHNAWYLVGGEGALRRYAPGADKPTWEVPLVEKADPAAGPWHVATGADGTVAVAGPHQQVQIVSAEGKPLAAAPLGSAATAVQFATDGRRLAVCTADKLVRVFDPADLRLLEQFTLPAAASGVAWLGDSPRLATVGGDNTPRIHPLALQGVLLGHDGPVNDLAYSPDGQWLGTASADKTARRWHAGQLREVQRCVGHEEGVSAVALTDSWLVSGSADGTVRVWPRPLPMPEPPAAEAGAADATQEPPPPQPPAVEEVAQPLRIIAHEAAVLSLAASPDGTRLVTAGQDQRVRVWDAEGLLLETFSGHTEAVQAVDIAADQLSVASVSQDKSARLWKLAARDVWRGAAGEITSLAVGPGGGLLTAGSDGAARWWSLEGQPLGEFCAGVEPLRAAALRPDGQQIATADAQTIYLWSLLEGVPAELERVLPAPAKLQSLAWEPNGTRLVACGQEEPAGWIIDAATGAVLQRFELSAAPADLAVGVQDNRVRIALAAGTQAVIDEDRLLRHIAAHQGAAVDVSFTPGGEALLSGGADGQVALWSLTDGRRLRRYDGAGPAVQSVRMTRDGGRMLAAASDGAIRVWPLSPPPAPLEEELQVPPAPQPAEGQAPPADAEAALRPQPIGKLLPDLVLLAGGKDLRLRVAPDGTRLAAADAQGTITLWDLASGLSLERFESHTKQVYDMDWSSNGQRLVSVGADQAAWVHAPAARRAVAAHAGGVNSLAGIGNGTWLSAGGDGVIKFWDAQGQLQRRIDPPEGETFARLRLRGDNNQMVVATAGGELALVNVGDGAVTARAAAGPLEALAYSADNQRVVGVGSEGRIRVWSATDAAVLQEIPETAPLHDVAFSPDGRLIWIGTEEGLLKAWRYVSPSATRTFTGHGGAVYGVAFSPDGQAIASCSADGTVRIWNVQTGAQVRQLTGHQGPVGGVAFSPDGAMLVSAGEDRTVRFWDFATGRQLGQAEIATRGLYTVDFSSDGRTVAAGGADKKLRLLEAPTGRVLHEIDQHPDYIYRVAFSPRGNRLLSCGYGGNLYVWDVASGKPLYHKELKTVCYSAQYSPDGTQLIVASGDRQAYFVPLPTAAQ